MVIKDQLGDVLRSSLAPVSSWHAHRDPTITHERSAGSDRALAVGATVSEVSIRAGQARSYTVDDPEGHRWYFSEPLKN